MAVAMTMMMVMKVLEVLVQDYSNSCGDDHDDDGDDSGHGGLLNGDGNDYDRL